MVEGAPHTAKRSKGSIVVSLGGASLLVYKGVEEGEGAGHPWRAPCWSRRGEGRRKREKGRGGAPFLVQFEIER